MMQGDPRSQRSLCITPLARDARPCSGKGGPEEQISTAEKGSSAARRPHGSDAVAMH